ncbi:NADH dehydrogenase 1 beta subcomplex subunit 3 [Abortiporus biennis]|nr:NADH dehydrogenase 1 beta subcomplex subunit 3 [Abortiporus biennis]
MANVNPPSPPMFRDPWAKREAWRKHPVFSKRAMLGSMFPGFGVAVVAFTAYVVYDNLVGNASESSKHH